MVVLTADDHSKANRDAANVFTHRHTHVHTDRGREREIYANTQRIVIFFSGTAVFFF